jgi:hypothetical protein
VFSCSASLVSTDDAELGEGSDAVWGMGVRGEGQHPFPHSAMQKPSADREILDAGRDREGQLRRLRFPPPIVRCQLHDLISSVRSAAETLSVVDLRLDFLTIASALVSARSRFLVSAQIPRPRCVALPTMRFSGKHGESGCATFQRLSFVKRKRGHGPNRGTDRGNSEKTGRH